MGSGGPAGRVAGSLLRSHGVNPSAASILAKVHRDAWCLQVDAEAPAYGFAAHKGYGTAEHLDALRRLGPTPHHRRSFAPLREWLAVRG